VNAKTFAEVACAFVIVPAALVDPKTNPEASKQEINGVEVPRLWVRVMPVFEADAKVAVPSPPRHVPVADPV
jgi:hypothetical protein